MVFNFFSKKSQSPLFLPSCHLAARYPVARRLAARRLAARCPAALPSCRPPPCRRLPCHLAARRLAALPPAALLPCRPLPCSLPLAALSPCRPATLQPCCPAACRLVRIRPNGACRFLALPSVRGKSACGETPFLHDLTRAATKKRPRRGSFSLCRVSGQPQI